MPLSKEMASPPSRKRTPLYLTRERVLSIAEKLFAKHGILAVSMDTVAEAANIKKMTLYRCYESKEALTIACLEQWITSFQQQWDNALERFPHEPLKQGLAFFQSVADRLHEHDTPERSFLHIIQAYPDPNHPIRRRLQEQYATFRAQLCLLLRQGDIAEPESLTDSLCLLMEGAVVASQCFGMESSPVCRFSQLVEQHMKQACGERSNAGHRVFRRW